MRLIGLSIFILLLGCTPKESRNDQEISNVAAQAFDKVLTWDEIEEIIPNQTSAEDSARIAEGYINDWLKEQVILQTARNQLPEESQQFEQELENYRKTLLTYAYENSFVQQRLDTVITNEEIESYYEANKEIFSLNDYIVKVKFCILEEDTPKLNRFKTIFQSDDPEDLVVLEQFCVDYGIQYYLELESWMYFEELLQKVPIEFYNVESFLKKNRSINFEKEGKRYFVKILEYQLKDEGSPLALVRNEIRNLILNKRKKELLRSMREELYKDAFAKGNVKKNYK